MPFVVSVIQVHFVVSVILALVAVSVSQVPVVLVQFRGLLLCPLLHLQCELSTINSFYVRSKVQTSTSVERRLFKLC